MLCRYRPGKVGGDFELENECNTEVKETFEAEARPYMISIGVGKKGKSWEMGMGRRIQIGLLQLEQFKKTGRRNKQESKKPET